MSEGKSFVAANEARVAGRKTSKSRVTLLIGCSMTGEKLPLLCIGSAKKPRWPVVLGKKADAPIAYASSGKGWMNTALFNKWLQEFNGKITRQDRQCMLLVDNCPAHLGLCEKYDGVKANLRLVMFPKNTTAKLQPCDQGFIRSLKAHYRGKLARLILNKEAKSVSL
ncbi:Tigger transposable element-derived protein 4-like [Oopsacas minuta]|uniref:Tigger transposable element-derived protein 4-like n=1 Tax=Oopsacas minuta TaxID=111878 RepID=A0AAV7JEX5_9METZ|nr:Tigger transposable element-derived protein 4-like [Oopsacas minuta]